MSTIIDRYAGVSDALGRKAPARCATTANVPLSGLTAHDGYTPGEGERVLVWKQTAASENGIYDASSGPWTRSLDFDGPADVVEGTGVVITEGTLYGSKEFFLTTSPTQFGTSLILFTYSGIGGDVTPVDGGGELPPGGVASDTFTQTDEPGALAIPLVKKLRQFAFFGDRKSITGNGTSDDTTAAQNEITYASAHGIQLLIPDGMKIRTTSTLTATGWTRIKGRGGHLMKNNANPNALGNYTGFHFDHAAIGINCLAFDTNTFDRADLEDFLIVRPQPTAVDGFAWTPNPHDFDISLTQTSANILGVECLRSKNFLRIDRNVGNQVVIDRVKGQVFDVGIQIKCALDSVYVKMAHFWPFWTGGYGFPKADPVLEYMLQAHFALHIMRCDGLSVGDVFAFAPRSTVLIDRFDGGGIPSIAGTLNNGSFHKIYNDNGASAITALGTAAGFIFRGNLVENYGSPKTYNSNGIDNNAPNSLLEIGAYWSNNARNSHAAATASFANVEIERYIEGSWGGSGGGAVGLVGSGGGRIDVNSWRRADAVSAPYSGFPITNGRATGKVFGKLSEGLTTVTTDANGMAFWPHGAGQMPVYSEIHIHSGGSAGAVGHRLSGFDATNLGYIFTNAAGTPCASKTDIIVAYKTFISG